MVPLPLPTGARFEVAAAGGETTNTLSLSGSLITNGAINFNPGSKRVCNVTFTGTSHESFSGTNSGGSRISLVTIDKGTSQEPSLTLNLSGNQELNGLGSGWLRLLNGTFRYIRSGKTTTVNLSSNTLFRIPPTAALSIDASGTNPIPTLNISNNEVADGADLMLFGKLELIKGVLTVGPPAGSLNSNNDIKYAKTGLPELIVQGGTLYVNGQIRREDDDINLGSLVYRQTGGDVIVGGNKALPNRAKFEVDNAGVFEMAGGTLTVLRGGGTTYGDVYINPGTSNVTGGSVALSLPPP